MHCSPDEARQAGASVQSCPHHLPAGSRRGFHRGTVRDFRLGPIQPLTVALHRPAGGERATSGSRGVPASLRHFGAYQKGTPLRWSHRRLHRKLRGELRRQFFTKFAKIRQHYAFTMTACVMWRKKVGITFVKRARRKRERERETRPCTCKSKSNVLPLREKTRKSESSFIIHSHILSASALNKRGKPHSVK